MPVLLAQPASPGWRRERLLHPARLHRGTRSSPSSEAGWRRLSVANVLGLPPGVEASVAPACLLGSPWMDLELLHLQSRLRTRTDLERTLCSSLRQPVARS